MAKSKFSMRLMHGHNKIALSLCACDAILNQNKKMDDDGNRCLIARLTDIADAFDLF